MERRRLASVCLVIITFLITAAESAIAAEPVIKKQGSNWTLELPENIQKAIREFNPELRPWELKDYSPRIRKEYKKADPRESPFAIIVDANHDGRADVIIDGHDKKRDLLVAVVSDHDRYKVRIIKEDKLSDPKTIENWNDKKKEKGLNYYLWLSKNGASVFQIGYPQVEFEDGTATDGALVEYLYENDGFTEKVNEL